MPLTPEQSRMVEENIKLAYYALHKYCSHFSDLVREDIISACFVGLVKAAQGFDPEKGKFSTYAMQAMYRQIIMEFCRGRKQVEPIYLEEIINKEDATFWQDIIGNDDSTEDEVIHRILGEQVMTALDNIKMGKTYKEIIKLHYHEPHLTQMQLAERVGCRQKTVSLAYGEARKKLRSMVCMG